MLNNIRKTLASVGGLQVVVAVFAIGWGISTLQRVADEREAYSELLAQEIAEREQRLEELAKQSHPVNRPAPPEDAPAYPAREDVDPLAQGADA